MKGISSADLMHHRLQAWLRENKCKDIEYLGERESYKSGKKHVINKLELNNNHVFVFIKIYTFLHF